MDGLGMKVRSTSVNMLDLLLITLHKEVSNITRSEERRVLYEAVRVDLREGRQFMQGVDSIKVIVGGVSGTGWELAFTLFLLFDLAVLFHLNVFVVERGIHASDVGRPERIVLLVGVELGHLSIDQHTILIALFLTEAHDIKGN